MKKLVLGLVLVAMACGCHCEFRSHFDSGQPAGPQSDACVEHMLDATVTLHEKFDSNANCSGVWVGPMRVLTAAHCVTQIDQTPVNFLFVKTRTGWKYRAVVRALDRAGDLAQLDITDRVFESHAVAELASDAPRVGDTVYAIGSPGSVEQVLSVGHVSKARFEVYGIPVVMVDLSIWYGNSGGPLFDQGCRLVGIASMIGPGPNFGNFVHWSRVRDNM